MLNRNALMLVAGAAIFALDASAVSAQDTTRTRPTSTKRIPVVKETGGEVVPMRRVDTLTVYHTDTLRLPGRIDTVTNTVTSTVTRYDTVTQMVPMKLRQIGGFYWGLGAGSSLPAANFNDSDHPGWRVEMPFGIDPVGSPLGLRFNLGYGRYEPHSYLTTKLENAQMMNADVDLKLRLVTGTPAGMNLQLYGIGGVSYNRFRDILENNHGVYNIGDAGFGNTIPTAADHAWHQGWGYNSGVGVQIGHGVTSLFIESRFARFSGEGSKISHIPVVVGLSWY